MDRAYLIVGLWEKEKGWYVPSLFDNNFYLPFGFGDAAGGLLPLPPPDGLPVVLGALVGLPTVFAILVLFLNALLVWLFGFAPAIKT